MKKLFSTLLILLSTSAFAQTVVPDTSGTRPAEINQARHVINQAATNSQKDQLINSLILFNLFDANKDGQISLSEAKELGMSEKNFKRLDTNGDNAINRDEFSIVAIVIL